MKGIVYTEFGSPEVLKIKEVAVPVPKDNQVLVKVIASSIEISDYLRFLRSIDTGKTPLYIKIMDTFVFKVIHKVPGGDVAGIIEKVGKNVKLFKRGDAVYGTSGMIGAWAEYACCAEKDICLKPVNITFEEAAAIPVAAPTALGAIKAANIKADEQVLISGASGGVGHFAVQLAKAYGAVVTGVCSERSIDTVKSIGADYVIDYNKEDFATNGKKYDVIIGVNGYRSISTFKKALADGGRYIVVGGMKQAMVGAISGPIRSIGSSKKMKGVALPMLKDKGFLFLNELIEAGKVKPMIDEVYSTLEIARAMHYIIKEHAKGKVAIRFNNEC